jgi:hypothetical protein
MSALPADMILDRKIDAIIADGHRLPRWGWPVPATYNGATGQERVYVWQKNQIAWQVGLMPERSDCSVCSKRQAEHWHGELYFRPFALMAICRSCHARVHRRFGSPHRWSAFLEGIDPDNWTHALLPEQLSRQEAMRLSRQPDWLAALKRLSQDRQADR